MLRLVAVVTELVIRIYAGAVMQGRNLLTEELPRITEVVAVVAVVVTGGVLVVVAMEAPVVVSQALLA